MAVDGPGGTPGREVGSEIPRMTSTVNCRAAVDDGETETENCVGEIGTQNNSVGESCRQAWGSWRLAWGIIHSVPAAVWSSWGPRAAGPNVRTRWSSMYRQPCTGSQDSK